MNFNKENYFPEDRKTIFLSHCSVSRLLPEASSAICSFNDDQSKLGFQVFYKYGNVLTGIHKSTAKILKTKPENISFLTNTSEGLNLIANGYPFSGGDSIISYTHEYPSNHYPWVLQKNRGVTLELLSNHIPDHLSKNIHENFSCSFSADEILKKITDRTRILSISHVQFTSGYAADLKTIGGICKKHGIDFIVDAAQSLGSMPLYPEEYGISAIASSGWKWLMGPIGTGLLYTSPDFRKKISHTMAGADLMEQGQDYLNHTWAPLSDARRFEYSTRPLSHAYGLDAAVNDLAKHSSEDIFNELLRLQDLFLNHIDKNKYLPLLFPENRSGILSLLPGGDLHEIIAKSAKKNLIVTERGGYLRIAPHFYNTDEEIKTAAEILNSI